MKTILIVIIAALIILGGMAVDELHIRQEYNTLEAENEALRQKVASLEQQLADAITRLHEYETQEAAWTQEKEQLLAEIADLQAQIQELTKNCTPATNSPVPNSILGLGLGGMIGSSPLLIGLINKTRQPRRPAPSRQNPEDQSHTRVRVLKG